MKAACERVWSKYNRTMPDGRASLELLTARALLLVSQYAIDERGILKFRPSVNY